MGVVQSSGAEYFHNNAFVVELNNHVKDFGLCPRQKFQEKNVFAESGSKLHRTVVIQTGSAGAVYPHSVGEDLSHTGRVYAFKSIESKSTDFDGPGSVDDFTVKGNGNSQNSIFNCSDSSIEIGFSICQRIVDRYLGAGKYNTFIKVLQHKTDSGRGVSHGICAMGNDDSVIGGKCFVYPPGYKLPFFGLNVRTVHIQNFLVVNVVLMIQICNMRKQTLRGDRRNETSYALL